MRLFLGLRAGAGGSMACETVALWARAGRVNNS
jgi:hypothetical protein